MPGLNTHADGLPPGGLLPGGPSIDGVGDPTATSRRTAKFAFGPSDEVLRTRIERHRTAVCSPARAALTGLRPVAAC